MRRIFVLILAWVLIACASEVKRTPSEMQQLSAQPRKLESVNAVEIQMDTGYHRTIRQGTQFVEVGRISQGMILKPLNAVLTIEGKHMHEAYVVLDGKMLTGFYLPVERSFSQLTHKVILNLQEISR